MKTSLLKQVRRMETLGRAWRVICENGRASQSSDTRREIEEFAATAEARLTKIRGQLDRGTFTFKPARGFPISKEGKKAIRPLVIAPVESRVVQRAIHDVLLTVPAICKYAENPYSFGGVKKAKGKSVAAVPAAIEAVLTAIGTGANYVIRSDISSFFTKIPKPVVTAIVADATQEPEFIELFTQAITVELENLASLREHAAAFPIYEIGVAQGSSLSPLLGNLLLFEFDQQMNVDDCRCIRYVDDFIILAPGRKVAERHFFKALKLLEKKGLETSQGKTFRGDIARGFEFLGIELGNGLIRPSKASRKRLIENVSRKFGASARAFRARGGADAIARSLSLIPTLYEVRGIVQGWGKSYFFCNEKNLFAQLDGELDTLLRKYLGAYKAAMNTAKQKGRRRLLGIPLLEELASRPFVWPKPSLTSSNVPPRPAAPAGFAEFSRITTSITP